MSVAQWVECHPTNGKDASLIPGQGMYPDCRQIPVGGTQEANQSMFLLHIDVSLHLFLRLKIKLK